MSAQKNKLFGLYEKLYFHEIEVREKLDGQLQVPMAVIVSLIGVFVYLLQNFDKTNHGGLSSIFIISFILSVLSLLAGIYFFIRSWFGSEYEFLPHAEDIEKYQEILITTYKPFLAHDDKLAENYLNEFLCNDYIKCTTKNAKNNEKRSMYLYNTKGAIILASVFFAFTFIFFYTHDLDKSANQKPSEIVIVKPIEIKGSFMNQKTKQPPQQTAVPPPQRTVTPPPPPPPPSTRSIKEGVETRNSEQYKGNKNGE